MSDNTEHTTGGSNGSSSVSETLESLRAQLKDWVQAGAGLGEKLTELADRVRTEQGGLGAHDAKGSQGEAAEKIKAAAEEIRENLKKNETVAGVRGAAQDFAANAEETFRDLKAKSKENTAESRAALAEALQASRENFDEALAAVKERLAHVRGESGSASNKTADPEAAKLVENLRANLENTLNQAASVYRDLAATSGERFEEFKLRVAEGAEAVRNPAADFDFDDDVIDGEILEVTEETTPGTPKAQRHD